MDRISTIELLQMHNYLDKIPVRSVKMEECKDKLEEHIHKAITTIITSPISQVATTTDDDIPF